MASSSARAKKNWLTRGQGGSHGALRLSAYGVALAALFKLVEQNVISPKDKVVVVSTAHGLKFPEFKTRYHAGDLEEFGVVPRFRQIPHEIGAEYGAVQSFVLRHLDGLRAKVV